MRVLLAGHKGYIGAVAGPVLVSAAHGVVGLAARDLRDLERADLDGFDAVVHFAALSNDPLGNLDAKLTYDVNYLASVRLAEFAEASGVKRFVFFLFLQYIRCGWRPDA